MDTKLEPQLNTWELPADISISVPAAVELFNADSEVLPAEIAANPTLREQSEQRIALRDSLAALFSQIPTYIDSQAALEQGLVTMEQLTSLYMQLADFLEFDPNNSRLILYLPFQIVPSLEQQQNNSVAMRFADSYRQAWLRLLHESEVRASFVDGDVLEPELGKPERVRKAAHMLPEVLEKGLIDVIDLLTLIEIVSDPELLKSLAAGIMVAADRNLFSADDWQSLRELLAIKSVAAEAELQLTETEEAPNILPTFEQLVCRVESELLVAANIEKSGISAARANWQKKVQCQAILVAATTDLVLLYQTGAATLADIANLATRTTELASLAVQTLIAIGHSLPDKVAEILLMLQSLKLQASDQITQGLNQWFHAGIIDLECINSLGVKPVDLSSALPVSPQDLIELDYRYLATAAGKIKDHPVLREYLYPCVLAFGSKVKGYAGSGSDDDIAIFIKPGVTWEVREQLWQIIRSELPELTKVDKILEFWLDSDGGFRSPASEISTVVGELQIHMLMGGLLIGDSETQKLYSNIVARYLNLQRYGENCEQIRSHLLRQLELDVLQYRLLHKGYRQFNHVTTRPAKANSHLIDWQADFWDNGYRRTASLLFLQRVFLPSLVKDL
jgi:hypothetical protein